MFLLRLCTADLEDVGVQLCYLQEGYYCRAAIADLLGDYADVQLAHLETAVLFRHRQLGQAERRRDKFIHQRPFYNVGGVYFLHLRDD